MSDDNRQSESGAADQFVVLYTQHEQRLFRYVATLLPTRQDAEDVLQETATVLWKKFDQYDRDQPFLPWARRIAYFEVLRLLDKEQTRKRHLSEAALEAISETRTQNEDLLVAQSQALQLCMEKISPDERELIQSRYHSSTPVVELAQRSGRKADTLYKSLERIRKKLLVCINSTLKKGGWGG